MGGKKSLWGTLGAATEWLPAPRQGAAAGGFILAQATSGVKLCPGLLGGSQKPDKGSGDGEDPQGLPPGCPLTKKKYLRAWIIEEVFLGTYTLKNSSDSEQKEERGQQFGPLAGESQSRQQQAASCQGSHGEQKELRVPRGT